MKIAEGGALHVGSVPQLLIDAYEEVAPLQDGHPGRRELHQLAPLLVHAVLFGGAYGAQAAIVARRCASS